MTGTDLSGKVSEYLQVRRALGYRLERSELLLRQFVDYCATHGQTELTIDVAVNWATLPQASPGWWGQRLSVVRCFASWLQASVPGTEVPPIDVLPARNRRAVPYLYTDAEVAALMAAARHLRWPLQQLTYETLVGLLAVTGMRLGEATSLDREDVDLVSGLLVVRNAKFGKSRQLSLHPSTIGALRRYSRRRDQLCPSPRSNNFLLSSAGTKLVHCNVGQSFRKMARLAGLVPRSARCRPRIHDFRHSFAVRTLVDWHRAGADVQALLPLLSTWMGHVDPKATYWYLSAAPELLGAAAARLEQTFEGGR